MRVLAVGFYRKGPGSNSLLDAKLNVIRKERETVGGRTRHSCSTFLYCAPKLGSTRRGQGAEQKVQELCGMTKAPTYLHMMHQKYIHKCMHHLWHAKMHSA